jgi:hypothetical protein
MRMRIFYTKSNFSSESQFKTRATHSQCSEVYYLSLLISDPFSVESFCKSLHLRNSLWAEGGRDILLTSCFVLSLPVVMNLMGQIDYTLLHKAKTVT